MATWEEIGKDVGLFLLGIGSALGVARAKKGRESDDSKNLIDLRAEIRDLQLRVRLGELGREAITDRLGRIESDINALLALARGHRPGG